MARPTLLREHRWHRFTRVTGEKFDQIRQLVRGQPLWNPAGLRMIANPLSALGRRQPLEHPKRRPAPGITWLDALSFW